MENPGDVSAAFPWKLYTISTAEAARFSAYDPPPQVPLLHYRAPRSSSFTYAHFPSAFPPVVLPTVRMRLLYPSFSISEDPATSRPMTDGQSSWRTLVSAALSTSAARTVEPFIGPPPLDHTQALPLMARTGRRGILKIMLARATTGAPTSTHSTWKRGGRKLFLAGIILFLLIAAFRKCRRARRLIRYLLGKLLKLYRRCWRRFHGKDPDTDDDSDNSGGGGIRSSRSLGLCDGKSPSPTCSIVASQACPTLQTEENSSKGEGRLLSADAPNSRCKSAPGSFVTAAGTEGEWRGARATTEGWFGLARWGGFRGSFRRDDTKKLSVRPSSFPVRNTDWGIEGTRGLGSASRDGLGKSTSSSLHRALHDFSLYVEAAANGGRHQCPTPTNTNIPSCFFLPSLLSAANPSPGADAEAVEAAAGGDSESPAGAHSRFCPCWHSQVTGAHGSDIACTECVCPYAMLKGEPVMIIQEAIYSSDSSPPASVYQGEGGSSRNAEEAAGQGPTAFEAPRLLSKLTGEVDIPRPHEVCGLAARFRLAAAAQGDAASLFGCAVRKKLDSCGRSRIAEALARGVPPGAIIADGTANKQNRKKNREHGEALIPSLGIPWAVLKRRLRRVYHVVLSLLRERLRKGEQARVAGHDTRSTASNTTGAEESMAAEADHQRQSYFQKLYRLVRLAFPELWSYESGCLVLLVSALVLRTFLSIWIASINGSVVQTIVQRDFGGFLRNLGVLIAYALPAAVVNAGIQFFEKMLALQLRRNLTLYLSRRYLKGLTFYRVAALDCRIPHPDEVMTASLSSFSLLTASLFSSFLKPLVDIVFLSRTLVRHLGVGAPVTLVAWYALTAFAMHAVAPPLGKRTARLQELEAKYRALHGDVLHHCEEIAFYGGARHAEQRLESAFDILYAYKRQVLMLYHLVLSSMDTLLAKHLAVVVGYAVVAGPSFRRPAERVSPAVLREGGPATLWPFRWKGGSAGSVGKISEVDLTHDYIRNSSLLINLAKAIGRILMSYKDVQQLSGLTERLNSFLRVLEDLDSGFFCTRSALTGALSRRSIVSTGTVKQLPSATAVQFRDVAVVTPPGQVLLDHVSFALPSGHNLFLLGPNGCGKTSLFRILGGLWPLLEGEITIPAASKLFYIPQRPYMPEGTLRDQVIYPMTYEDYKSLSADTDRIVDDHLEELLDIVGLHYILKRCPEGWDTWGDWEDILSGGEKQRMAFARLLLHKPVFAILDEATSAVSVDLEGALYRRCAEAQITLITISHNISLLKYHQYVLRFAGVGAPGRRWTLESTEGLKHLDSYSFLLNLTPSTGQADALAPTADKSKVQCADPAAVPSRYDAVPSPQIDSSSPSPRKTVLLSGYPAGQQQQPAQQIAVSQDADAHSGAESSTTAIPHIVLLGPPTRPNGSTIPSTNAANASQRLAPLPSRGSRVSSPARVEGRCFPGGPASLSPAAVGSAAAEATVSTLMSMRRN